MQVTEIPWRNPYSAFAPLAGEPYAHMLHAGELAATDHWSIITAFPSMVIEASAGDEDPFIGIDSVIRERRAQRAPEYRQFPFLSGLLGFIGYEAAEFIERGLNLPASGYAAPDMSVGVYDAAVLFSRRDHRAYIAGTHEAAVTRLYKALGNGGGAIGKKAPFGAVSSNFSPQAYKAAVSSVIDNILDGDYYQANISQRLMAAADELVDVLALFQTVASASDASFGALLQLKNFSVVSNSPERFFKLRPMDNGKVRIVAEPIKGTRRRGGSNHEDRKLAQDLMADRKDRAENIMIADLIRNDLSRICRNGTVCEEAVCDLMTLSNVHHLVSRISGELRVGVMLSDILKALFPCGSITGTPKIEAMHAIARHERIGRGPYCGAIGYIDDGGGADFSVAIRAMMVQGRSVSVPVGGGVTLRSDPMSEYDETIVKAAGALGALGVTWDSF